MIPRNLNSTCRRFGTRCVCSIFTAGVLQTPRNRPKERLQREEYYAESADGNVRTFSTSGSQQLTNNGSAQQHCRSLRQSSTVRRHLASLHQNFLHCNSSPALGQSSALDQTRNGSIIHSILRPQERRTWVKSIFLCHSSLLTNCYVSCRKGPVDWKCVPPAERPAVTWRCAVLPKLLP